MGRVNYFEKKDYADSMVEAALLVGAKRYQIRRISITKNRVNSAAPLFPDKFVTPGVIELRDIAREAFKNPSRELENMLEDYKLALKKIQDGQTELDICERHCPVCDYDYLGGFDLSPMVLYVYNWEIKKNFP